jgi:hypothetical protein
MASSAADLLEQQRKRFQAADSLFQRNTFIIQREHHVACAVAYRYRSLVGCSSL